MSLPRTTTGALPWRFESTPGERPVVSVDGVWGADGLHLSHWPGNATPPGLKRDLSTGIALEYARLPESERAALADGCDAVAVNHFDTDGVCALFAVLQPDRALEHAQLLLDAAAAGDRFHVPSREGFRLDAILLNLANAARSPLDAAVFDLPSDQRHARLVEAGLETLERVLDEGLAAFESQWAPEERALDADLADLAGAHFDDLVHLDVAAWTAPADRGSSRVGAPEVDGRAAFDPGRHAMLGDGRVDRVLALGPSAAGTTARFVVGTGSFFDLASGPASARPDLVALCDRLNALEGSRADTPVCWRHQDPAGASPELWFGAAGLPLYGEHACPFLGRSRLDADTIRLAVLDAVRDVWALPDDDDEAEDGEDIFDV